MFIKQIKQDYRLAFLSKLEQDMNAAEIRKANTITESSPNLAIKQ